MIRRASHLLLLATAMALPALGRALGVGDAAPPMKVFRWVKGSPVSKFQTGKLYVVEFWATWCGPCKESIPHLTELAKTYKDVTFAGISVSEAPTQKAGGTDVSYMATVRKFVTEEGSKMVYNVGADSPDGVMGSTWMDAAHQDGIPTAFLIDKGGKIAWIGHPSALEPVLKQAIAGTLDTKAQAESASIEDELKPYIADMQEGKFHEAVVVIDKVMAAHPKEAGDLIPAKFDALAREDPNLANDFAGAALNGPYKANPVVLNSIAWAMVDDEENLAGMDTKLAEKLATQALTLLDQKSRDYAETLDTLALCQYKNGKEGDAEANELRAVDLYSKFKDADQETLKHMRTRLTKYQNIKV